MGFLSRFFGRPTPDDFAEDVIRAIRKIKPDVRVKYDKENFALQFSDDAAHCTNLYNGYEEYRRALRSKQKEIVQRWAKLPFSSKNNSTKFEEVKENILPRVRERSYHSVIALQYEAKGLEPPRWLHQTLGEYYTVVLAIDYPDSIAEPGVDTVKEWPVKFDVALKLARENLWKRSNEDWNIIQPGLYISPWRDNHDASRLVLHDLIWQLKVDGNHVAVAPNRDLLIVTGRNDVKGLQKMADLARTAMDEPRFMTSVAVELHGSEWVPLKLEPTHPALNAFMELMVHSKGREYTEQKEWLEKIHEKKDIDIFVASLIILRNNDTGAFRTVTSWGEDVHSYLPIADEIAFGLSRGEICYLAWDTVMTYAGELLKPLPDLFPVRYEVREFPSTELFKKMNAKFEKKKT